MFAGVGRSLPAGVVAADVDGEVVRILIEVAEEFQIVGRGVLDGCGGVFPDVAPHDNPLVGAAEVADGGFESPVCDSDAADDRLVLREPEDARAGIPTGLRNFMPKTSRSSAGCSTAQLLCSSQRPPGMSPMMRRSSRAILWARSMGNEKRMGFMILRYIVARKGNEKTAS